MAEIVLAVAGWLIFVNLAAYVAFAWDKRQSKRPGAQRIPEKTLLNIALVGGGVGAKLAQSKLRHKSYKQPFGKQLNVSIAMSVVIPTALIAWLYWPF